MKTSATSKLKEPEFQTLMQKLSVEQPAILDLAAAEEKTLEFTKGLRAGRRWSSRWSRRRLRHVLPDVAEWPKAQLEKVERAELKLLCAFAERCREQGLDSPILNQLVLAVLCAHAQA
eukprot:s4950_g1.t1